MDSRLYADQWETYDEFIRGKIHVYNIEFLKFFQKKFPKLSGLSNESVITFEAMWI